MKLLYNGLYLLLVLICFLYLIWIQKGSAIGWQLKPVTDANLPKVSIIIPTLNEERNIKNCLESLKNLDYPKEKIEIIVSDGGSKDATVQIANEYADVVIVDSEVPRGWLGKSYGCYLGYKESKGDILLFTDADTFHEERSLKINIFQLLGSESTLVSMLPYQKAKKWYEYMVGYYFFLSYFVGGPMKAIIDKNNKSAYMAIGQYLLFTRKGYESIGGHEAVKGSIIEDIALAKRVKEFGQKIYFLEPNKLVSTRMYPDSFLSFYKGFRKVIFEGLLNFPVWRIFFIVLWIVYSFISAYFVVQTIVDNPAWSIDLLFNLGLYFGFSASYFSYWHKRGDGSLFFYIFHPLGMTITVFIIITSIVQGILGKPIQWKNRQYINTQKGNQEKNGIEQNEENINEDIDEQVVVVLK
ncbi:MAG: glycosyltransferase [Candidatus Heimdallarchaeum aukensis]|uniref:Glycosyltransferase n=1 Tax=Candidatus Heimdallarchaeum aukensis TaxID=2876573 RepID=A0A9Y1BM72_9ARCH|nr:MAG: glycosyltransferase [Candidatus Heimdallarchaeum aukensis]